jgi:hypothetical protein
MRSNIVFFEPTRGLPRPIIHLATQSRASTTSSDLCRKKACCASPAQLRVGPKVFRRPIRSAPIPSGGALITLKRFYDGACLELHMHSAVREERNEDSCNRWHVLGLPVMARKKPAAEDAAPGQQQTTPGPHKGLCSGSEPGETG